MIFLPAQRFVKRGLTDLEAHGGFTDRKPFRDHPPRAFQLLLHNNRPASAFAATCRGRCQSSPGAFSDQVALELPQGAEQVKD